MPNGNSVVIVKESFGSLGSSLLKNSIKKDIRNDLICLKKNLKGTIYLLGKSDELLKTNTLNMENKPTLFEWVGELKTFEKLISTFYNKVLKDDLLGEVFENMSDEHIKRVSHFIAEVFGGPKLYTEQDNSSHAKMIGKHFGKMLTEEKRQRWVQLLLQTADEIGVKSDPEFRSAFVGYLEWGSRIAVINSRLKENPMDKTEPMPQWGWGETGGPYISNK